MLVSDFTGKLNEFYIILIPLLKGYERRIKTLEGKKNKDFKM